jgi:hypothetical protein
LGSNRAPTIIFTIFCVLLLGYISQAQSWRGNAAADGDAAAAAAAADVIVDDDGGDEGEEETAAEGRTGTPSIHADLHPPSLTTSRATSNQMRSRRSLDTQTGAAFNGSCSSSEGWPVMLLLLALSLVGGIVTGWIGIGIEKVVFILLTLPRFGLCTPALVQSANTSVYFVLHLASTMCYL